MNNEKCAKCDEYPWACPRDLTDDSVIKKVCCGREARFGDVRKK